MIFSDCLVLSSTEEECPTNIVKKLHVYQINNHETSTFLSDHNQSSHVCPPAIVTMQHQGWSRSVPGHLALTPKPWADFQQQGRAGSFVSFSPTLTRSLGAARAPLLHRAARFLLSRIAKSERGQAGLQRVLLGFQHNLSIALTFKEMQNWEPFLQLMLNDRIIVEEKAADGNITVNATERTKRIHLFFWIY